MRQLTKIVGNWFAPPSNPDFLGKVGLNLALGLVTSCRSCQGACLAPVRAIRVGMGFYKKKIPLHIVERCEGAARQSHKRFRRCNIKLIILFDCFIAGQSIKGRHKIHMFFFLKKWVNPGLFSFIFVFSNTHYNFSTNKFEKMSIQYTVPGFELKTFGTWVSSHNHWNELLALVFPGQISSAVFVIQAN